METEFRGVQGFDITTGAFLFDPEKAFEVTDKINENLPESRWVGIEVYPVQKYKYLRRFELFPDVTVDKIHKLQSKYNHTKISRIHIEFAYDNFEKNFMIEKGNFHKSRFSPLWHKILYRQIQQATAGYGMALARDLNVGANMHTNVVLGLIKSDQLDLVKKEVKDIIVENSINYNCPFEQGPILYDPRTIIDEIVEKYGFKKFLLGMDHLIDYFDIQRIDPLEIIKDEKVRKYTYAIHIAGANHGIIKTGDTYYKELLKDISQTTFNFPVRLVFDYSPLALLRYPTLGQKTKLFSDTIDWIRNIHG